jgi:hypothetical protein
MKVTFKNINGSNIYYIILILHFRYSLKKNNNKAIWFFGLIIVVFPWKGSFNPTINKIIKNYLIYIFLKIYHLKLQLNLW